MNKKFSYLFLASLLLLFSCGNDNSTKVEYKDFACIETQSFCQKNTTYSEVSVLFNVEKIRPETDTKMRLTVAGQKQVKTITGFIEGKSMYMGKIPLFYMGEKVKQVSETLSIIETGFMLGSCSDKNMVWRMRFKIEYVDHTTDQFFMDFSSVQ